MYIYIYIYTGAQGDHVAQGATFCLAYNIVFVSRCFWANMHNNDVSLCYWRCRTALRSWMTWVLGAISAEVILTSVKCTGGAAPQRSATGGNRGPQGPPRAPRAQGHFSHFSVFFGCFRGRGAFQGVPGGRGSVLTKYEPKRTHLDLIHHIFDDFSVFFRGSRPGWGPLLCP